LPICPFLPFVSATAELKGNQKSAIKNPKSANRSLAKKLKLRRNRDFASLKGLNRLLGREQSVCPIWKKRSRVCNLRFLKELSARGQQEREAGQGTG
jgi:hypothetical protein